MLLAFAYATNGNRIIEFDLFVNASRELERFPSPQDLWRRWVQNAPRFRAEDLPLAADPFASYGSGRHDSPLLHSYCPETLCGKRPHYFQEVAVREVIKRLLWGQRRVLLAMATGAGKTFLAFRIQPLGLCLRDVLGKTRHRIP